MSEPAPLFVHPTRQRGAYAVVFDPKGKVLVVRTQSGRCYLPGGRIEPGEGPRQALSREIAEECGWSAEIGGQICEQQQLIFAGRVDLQASYWRTRLGTPLATLPEHEAMWLSPAEAIACLHRASDRAALAAALT